MENKNSKFGLIFTIVCNLAMVLCFVIGLITMLNVKLPDKIEKNQFIKYMEEKGCSLIDIQKEEQYYGIDNYLITDKETCSYLISYTTFNDKNTLEEFLINTKNDVLYKNTNIKGTTSISINLFSEYYEYTTSGDYYKAMVYNDNSILYASADQQYKDEIINIFKDLNYTYEVNGKEMEIAGYSIFILLFICIASMWGTFKKTRNKGWIALIPFYNIGCLSKDILGSSWFALLLLLPIINIIFMFTLYYKIGKAFNKHSSYCILMMFIPTILWPLLAFDSSKYDFK